MKKIHNIIFSLFILIVLVFNFLPLRSNAADRIPSRAIYVVYDDSGSMIHNGAQKVDTWCQAKYSMEVFAAMLGTNDTMNIYVMSDYVNSSSNGPRIVLNGSDGPEVNVKKVHDMVTYADETPFDSVKKALSDLEKDGSDEKWLVILTDGVFNMGIEPDQVDPYLQSKSDDINIVFLGMGADAASITDMPSQNIYYEHAETNSQILSKITGICSRIFNYDRLYVDTSSGEFTFDVPMSELVIFAQGENVSINGLFNPDGGAISYTGTPVSVRYSEKATSRTDYANFNNPLIDKGLEGSITTYRGMYDAGTYKADVSNAKTLEIYYKPAVEIMAYLEDDEGNLIPYTDGVPAGDYIIKFSFVKEGTDEPVGESGLLGDISYEAKLYHDGTGDGKTYTNGDRITVEEGLYSLDVNAEYLRYHTVSTEMEFTVFCDKEITFRRINSPQYVIDQDGLVNADTIEIKAQIEGRDFTPEEWSQFNADLVISDDSEKRIILEYKKGDEPGTIYITPSLADKGSMGSEFGNIIYGLNSATSIGQQDWIGSFDDSIPVRDDRPWWIKNRDLMIKLLIGLGILFLILGYIPGIKHYLPKNLKSQPNVTCQTLKRPRKTSYGKGQLSKNTLSTILPYVPQTGSVRCVPKNSSGTKLMLKAKGSRKMEVTNTSKFAGNDNVTFNYNPVEKDYKKKLLISANTTIVTKTAEVEYTCTLNQ